MTTNKIAEHFSTGAASQPGRSCPLHYRYSPNDFARAADFSAETLYVIGGLYGNVPALEAVLALAAREPGPVTLCFNGDFNWFNIDDASFRAINTEVLLHQALRGNVETEIAGDDESASCGCGYPEWVSDSEVARSNTITLELRETARRHPELRARLVTLPMNFVAEVGNVRIAIVHGDLESLAGWSLSQETLDSDNTKNIVIKQVLKSKCRVVASSHTCLPVALTLDAALGRCAVFNNGAAGMPNFHNTQYGVITRVSAKPSSTHAALYGTRVDNVHIDAIAVEYDTLRWQIEFLQSWPEGSAAHRSYHKRITTGPDYSLANATRL